MDSASSNLTSLGCDFVVATTQASINSSMLKVLDAANQPVKYLCYLVNPTSRDLEDPITLEDLMKQTGGINPFDIPKGTSYDDPKITACTKAHFQVGIKIQIGIPPVDNPRDLSIVNLIQNAYGVDFNMYCRDITVIENDAVEWGYSGSWNIWKQPYGQPWTASCLVDVRESILHRELDEDPYFRSHRDIQAQLMRALENLGGTDFRLQQLRLDWSHAVQQDDADFPGMDMKTKASGCLRSCLFNEYHRQFARGDNMPPLVVTAVANAHNDPSLLTGSERLVNPPKDSYGNTISSPSSSEKAITTLDYICAINNDRLPSISGFNWNWVRPDNVNSESGAIAISRNVVAQLFLDYFKRLAPQYMYEAISRKEDNYRVQLLNGKWLSDATADLSNGDSSRVLHIQSGVTPIEPLQSWDGNNGMKVYIGRGMQDANAYINPGYSCDVYFEDKEVRVEQRIWLTAAAVVVAEFAPHGDGDSKEHKLYDTGLTEKYSLAVDNFGEFRLLKTTCVPNDNYNRPDDGDPDSYNPRAAKEGFFYQLYQKVASSHLRPSEIDLHSIIQPNRFVFPGAQPFVYKDAFFSKHQDLVARIPFASDFMN
ncbi:hypothetical protein GGI35DRAFT_65622 [Trichoderma velutinum]